MSNVKFEAMQRAQTAFANLMIARARRELGQAPMNGSVVKITRAIKRKP